MWTKLRFGQAGGSSSVKTCGSGPATSRPFLWTLNGTCATTGCMSRKRQRPSLPPPATVSLEAGDLVVLVPARDPSLPYQFGEMVSPSLVRLRAEPRLVRVRRGQLDTVQEDRVDPVSSYVVHAVDRGGSRIAKVYEPNYAGLWCRRLPEHPGMGAKVPSVVPAWVSTKLYRRFYDAGWRKELLDGPGMPRVLAQGAPCLWTWDKKPGITARVWFVAPGAWSFVVHAHGSFHMGQKKEEGKTVTAAYTHVLDALRVAS